MAEYRVRFKQSFLLLIIAFAGILIYFCIFSHKSNQMSERLCYAILLLGLLVDIYWLSHILFEYIFVKGSQMIYRRPFRREKIYFISDVSDVAADHPGHMGTFEFTVYVGHKKAFTFTAWHENYERLLCDLRSKRGASQGK